MFIKYSDMLHHGERSFYCDSFANWINHGFGYACLWPAFTTKMFILRDWRTNFPH
jgi:hypothetical protein